MIGENKHSVWVDKTHLSLAGSIFILLVGCILWQINVEIPRKIKQDIAIAVKGIEDRDISKIKVDLKTTGKNFIVVEKMIKDLTPVKKKGWFR